MAELVDRVEDLELSREPEEDADEEEIEAGETPQAAGSKKKRKKKKAAQVPTESPVPPGEALPGAWPFRRLPLKSSGKQSSLCSLA